MSAVQLKALFNAACKFADNAWKFLSGGHVNVLSDGNLQCSNGARVAKVDGWKLEVLVRRVRFPLYFSFAADKVGPNVFMEPCYSNISYLRRNTILLEPLYHLIKVHLNNLHEFSSELLKLLNVTFFCNFHWVTPIIFREKWTKGAVFPDGD